MTGLAFHLLVVLITATPGFLVHFTTAACSPSDCLNGGVCNNITASPLCFCPLPYIGSNCAAAANYCSTLQPEKGILSFPVCNNSGNCTMGYVDPYFSCSCIVNQTVVYGDCTCINKYKGLRCSDTEVTMTKGTASPQVVASMSECESQCKKTSDPQPQDYLTLQSKIAIGFLVPASLVLIAGILLYLCCPKCRFRCTKNTVGCLDNSKVDSVATLRAYKPSDQSQHDRTKDNGTVDLPRDHNNDVSSYGHNKPDSEVTHNYSDKGPDDDSEAK